jgi:uncharacterized protein YbjT (DUF2867 family)
MKILLVGATGGTGRAALPLLLAAGHDVTAYVRKLDGLAEAPTQVRRVSGDVRDGPALKAALAAQEAVFSVLGPRSLGKDDLQEVYMRNLVAGMTAQGVKRLVNLSAWGAGDSASEASLLFKFARATLLRHIYPDKERGEAVLFASPIDYVNVRPGRLLNAPARGGVRASLRGAELKPLMTRADLAAFMVAQLRDDTWLRKSPLIGY